MAAQRGTGMLPNTAVLKASVDLVMTAAGTGQAAGVADASTDESTGKIQATVKNGDISTGRGTMAES